MSHFIKSVRDATTEEWDYIWEKCDYATYFHSLQWAKIWQKYTHGKMKPDAKLIMFSDGKTALLPFSSQRFLKGLAEQYISSPAGTFGGWLSLNELSKEHARLLSHYIIKHYKNLVWRINPYDPLASYIDINISEEDETHVLNLEHGFDAVYKKWTKGHTSATRKARKAGIIIHEANNLKDWETYFSVYEDSLKRWGAKASSHYNWQLFRDIFNLSSSNIKLWLASYDNKIISGALCFYAKKHVVYWHGASLSEYFKLRPVNLLMYEIITNSCNSDYKWFDFNPSGGHEGVRAFKKSFGALELSSPVINIKKRKINIMIKIWQAVRGRKR